MHLLRSKSFRWLICLATLVIVAPLLFCASIYGNRRYSQYLLKKLEDETTATDPTWRYEDMEVQRYRNRPPDAENAALWIRERSVAIDSFCETNVHVAFIASLANSPPNHQFRCSQSQYLAHAFAERREEINCSAALAILDRGYSANEERIGFLPKSVLYDNPPAYWTRSCERISEIARAELELAVQRNDANAALLSFRAMLNCSRAIGDDPSCYAHASVLYCRASAIAALERLLAHFELDDLALATLQFEVGRDESRDIITPLVRGLRATPHYWVVDQLPFEGVTYRYYPNAMWLYAWYRHTGRDSALAWHSDLTYLNALVALSELPEHRRIDAASKLCSQLRLNQVEQLSWTKSVHFALNDTNADKTQFRSALALIACERYRLLFGDFPKQLDELVAVGLLDAVPKDPFTGQPLKYVRTRELVTVLGSSPDAKVYSLWYPQYRRLLPDGE